MSLLKSEFEFWMWTFLFKAWVLDFSHTNLSQVSNNTMLKELLAEGIVKPEMCFFVVLFFNVANIHFPSPCFTGMTLLNKTKWKGGTLQIQLAKESFLHR